MNAAQTSITGYTTVPPSDRLPGPTRAHWSPFDQGIAALRRGLRRRRR